jgi:hypothetical protein
VTTIAIPSIADQFSAAMAAIVPFFIAVFSVWWASVVFIWRAFEWRYAGIVEKYKTVLELTLQEADILKRKVERLEEAADKFNKQPSPELAADVREQAVGVGQANTAIIQTLTTLGGIGRGRVCEDVVQPVYVPEDEKKKS